MIAMAGHSLFPSILPTEDDESDDVDAETLADQHYQTVVSTVTAGEADDVLEELADVDDRASVQDAIADRQEVLEDE